MDIDKLRRVRARLLNERTPSYDTDFLIAEAVGWRRVPVPMFDMDVFEWRDQNGIYVADEYSLPEFTASFDAVKELHDKILPGWDVVLHMTYDLNPHCSASVSSLLHPRFGGLAETATTAWLIADLEALIYLFSGGQQ